MEEAAYDYFRRIDELGGMVEAVKQDFPQREIADASFVYQTEVDRGERIIVGVNRFADDDEESIPILRIDPALERKQIGRVEAVRARRDTDSVESALAELREAASGEGNLMYPLLDCARAHCSEGEIIESLQQVFGSYTETPVFEPARDGSRGCRLGGILLRRMADSRKIRVVVAKPGLDGHDRGAKIIARALRDAGMEVIYTGLHQTPEQIVETVLQEDANAVGLSILSGAHMTLVPKIARLLEEQNAEDVVLVVGGTIPSDDIPELKELGVAEVFTPGSSVQEIVDYIEGAVPA